MFQFRRFPTYTYLIQYTLTEYCSAGFPHSEISGSTLICSSPKLIAACHVLHRLLMPRHSPCALFRLTILLSVSLASSSELCRLFKEVFWLIVSFTLRFHNFLRQTIPIAWLLASLLPCLSLNSLFSFQGALLPLAFFKARFQCLSLPLNTEIYP